MNKVYIFWIVCGVLAVGAIAVGFLISPQAEAQQVKESLDRQQKSLDDLGRRAANKAPKEEFNAEVASDIERLTKEYIITDSWKPVLTSHRQKYAAQTESIKQYLVGRSQFLHQAVSTNTNRSDWYVAYIQASESVLQKLVAANRIVAPARIAAAPGAAVSTDEGSPAELRSVLGLFTKSADFPSPDQHPRLTTQLRIAEHLAGCLLAAEAPLPVNPVVGATTQRGSAPATPVLTALVWRDAAPGGEAAAGPALGPVSELADGIGVSLTLSGPVSALLAAERQLGRNQQHDRPIVVVQGASLARKENFASGERLDEVAESAVLKLELLVLDFTKAGAAAGPAPAAGATP